MQARHADIVWDNYYEIATQALKAGCFTTSETMFRAALEFSDRDEQVHLNERAPHFARQAACAHGLGLCLLALERSQEAQSMLRKAVRLYLVVGTLDSRLVAQAALALADSYCAEQKISMALPMLKSVCRAITRKDGIDCDLLAELFIRVAAIYADHNYFDRAEKYLRRALKLHKIGGDSRCV